MTTRKKKLETSLEGLFSKPKDTKGVADETPEENASSTPVEKAVKTTTPKKASEKAPAKPKTNAPKAAEPAPVPATQAEVPTPKADPAQQKEAVPVAAVAEVKEAVKPENKEAEKAAEAGPQAKSDGQAAATAMAVVQEQGLVTQVKDEEDEDDIQILVFEINNVAYGIDVALVQTIIKPQAVFLVPGTVDFLKGLINLRGAVVPVIDMRTRFDLPEKEADKETRFIVVEIEDIMASMVVDQVDGVHTISSRVIEKPSGLVMDIDNRYLTGMARMDDQIVLILDLLQAIRPEKVEQHN